MDNVPSRVAEGSQRYAGRVRRIGAIVAAARESSRIEPLRQRVRERVHARNHVRPIRANGGQRNVRAGCDRERLSAIEADNRSKLPALGQPLSKAGSEAAAFGNRRRVENVAPVEVAVSLFTTAVVGILIVVARQLTSKIVRADAMRPGVVGQPCIVVRETMLHL